MIAYLSGNVIELEPTHAIIDCHGVGYLAKISLNTYGQLKDQQVAKLHTYLQVREDAQTLFGFGEKKEKKLFEQLISISGVGGNTALMILSSLSAEELVSAIQQGDDQTLKRIKGIGAKTAARIVLELKDKVATEVPIPQDLINNSSSQKREEALAALLTLGFPKQTMIKRIEKILTDLGPDTSVEEIIKRALKST